MKESMYALATEFNMSHTSLKVTSLGLYSCGTHAYPTARGVTIHRTNKQDQFIDSFIARSKLIRLMGNPELMYDDIVFQAAMILISSTSSTKRYIEVSYVLEGERVICTTPDGIFRINVNTKNVTQLIDNKWLIINVSNRLSDRIEKLHATLIQVGLMPM